MNEPPFISLPIYIAATTRAASSPTMHEPTTNSHPTPAVNGDPGSPQPPPTLTCFRLLCHSSRIGGVIGKSGAIIKQLEQDTSAKIQVEYPPDGSDDRIIVITADSSVKKTMSYDEDEDQENNGYIESSEYSEVSAAQEALIRVFERILSVAAEAGGGYSMPAGVVSCRLLADSRLIGSVIGKGGKVIEKIRDDTGCKIRVLGRDKFPSCALPIDEMIQIEGDIITTKKAIVAISRRLQDCTHSGKTRTALVRPHVALHRENLTNGHMDFRSTRTPVLQPMPIGYANHPLGGCLPVSFNFDSVPSMGIRNSQQEIVFQILCSSNRVGGVIGKSGTIIRALQNQSGASITVGAPSDCNEQIITITAMESPESRISPALHAVILVFSRCVAAGFEKGLVSLSTGSHISARLVIQPDQVGCLLGKGGSIIADMRKVTGAVIKIVGGHEVPSCASETDHIVLMTGEFLNVQDALYSVASRLRNHLFSRRMPNGPGTSGTYGRGNNQPLPGSQSPVTSFDQSNQHATLTQSMDNLKISSNTDQPPPVLRQSQAGSGNPRSEQDVGRGSTCVKGGIELGRGSRSAVVTNTTVEITVSENVIGSVYGDKGNNLNRLRQISGAKVVVHEPEPGTTDHIVIISGTPDETRSAQSLLEASILADQP